MVRQVKKSLKIGVIMDFFKDALKDAVDIANRIVIAVNKFGSLSNFGVLKCLCTPGEDMH